MHRWLYVLILVLATTGLTAEDLPLSAYPRVKVETNLGDFTLELDGPLAPISVSNFVRYVREGAYKGSVFHRVIAGFMAQGGGFDEDFRQLPFRGVIPNEAGNGLRNERGTIAMARAGGDPHSASRQFFINLVDNPRLDPRTTGWGYAVFGRVIDGMETVDKIAALPTGPGGPFPGDVPQSPVIIEAMSLVEKAAPE